MTLLLFLTGWDWPKNLGRKFDFEDLVSDEAVLIWFINMEDM